jgi:hypothetical protein
MIELRPFSALSRSRLAQGQAPLFPRRRKSSRARRMGYSASLERRRDRPGNWFPAASACQYGNHHLRARRCYTGGSIGVSLASNVLAHRAQFHQSSLASHAIPSGISYRETMQQLIHYFAAQGSSIGKASNKPSPGLVSRSRRRHRCLPL